MNNFTILSFNIHKGFHFFLRKYHLGKLRNVITASGADMVFLQEVMGFHPEKYKDQHQMENQFEYLADETWSHFVYGKNAIYASGDHGNAILSKYPFVFFQNNDLSTNQFEKRGILHGRIEVAHRSVNLLCVHLNLTEKGRQKQIREIVNYINENIAEEEPLILAGDFNDWQLKGEKLLSELSDLKAAHYNEDGKILKTYPAHLPLLGLDRVYYRGLNWHGSEILPIPSRELSSDHLPIRATFSLEP